MYDIIVIGGGIVGLSTTLALVERYPNKRILVIEKEDRLAVHQTGHNSGVIHSGIYYKPGSLKARLAREGNAAIIDFCRRYGIKHEVCGKVIVATEQEELPYLEQLYQRGMENQVPVEKINRDQLIEIEPHVKGIAALHVKSVGIVNFTQVCEVLQKVIQEHGVEVALKKEVVGINRHGRELEIQTRNKSYKTRFLINCAGLYSDRIAKLAGVRINVKIVPFRGEYYALKREKRYLVKNLIYPVPNPNFPFLGVHFTRMIDGSVKIGPNAVLSFKREGYNKWDFKVKDFTETMMYPGFWKLASRYWREGLNEYVRSYRKAVFLKDAQRFIPELGNDDISTTTAGVRAQALTNDGTLVDDFFIVQDENSIHVCNAPSPAATASVLIGKSIVERIKSMNF